MIERVLIATCADDAYSAAVLRVGGMYAVRWHLPAEVYAVAEPVALPLPAHTGCADDVEVGRMSRVAAAVRHRMDEVVPALQAAVVTDVGVASDAIAARADATGATLVVVGLGRHGRLVRLLGADTVIGVIRRCQAPVLAVAADAQCGMTVLMLATDGSVAAGNAARAAFRFVAEDAHIHVVYVMATHDLATDASALAALADWADGVPLPPRCTRALHVLRGDAAAELLAFVQSHGVDLIALGTQGRGLWERLRQGSVAETVLRHAPCSVLVVGTGASGAGAISREHGAASRMASRIGPTVR
jgi:nucleotide-binding universal stress UspA family protein